MSVHNYTITLHALNDFATLPRITLVFSRRRLKFQRFEMNDTEGSGIAQFTITLQCSADTAQRLIKQLYKIVEVMDVAISEANDSPSAQAAG